MYPLEGVISLDIACALWHGRRGTGAAGVPGCEEATWMPLAARLEERPFPRARAHFEELAEYMASSEACAMRESELERELEARARKVLREMLQEHLDARGPGEATGPVRDGTGAERTETRLQERGLKTVFGRVDVRRLGYAAAAEESLHPRDGELNLPRELYSLELRRRAAMEASKGSFEQTVEMLERTTGSPIPKRQVEELVVRAAKDFDAFYAASGDALRKPSGPILAVSVDGKGVRMIPRDLREGTRKAAAKAKAKLESGESQGKEEHRKRMATVATVYTVDRYVRTPEQFAAALAPRQEADREKRPRPEDKRVWASLEQDPEQVIAEAIREARSRDPKLEKTWVALVDGNETQLDILEREAVHQDIELIIVLDIMHVYGYLCKAGLAFHAQGSKELAGWIEERLLNILRGRASLVAAGMRRSVTLREFAGDRRAPVDECADYLLKYAPYLQYDKYLETGLPIATGVVEGACRHLVMDRMDCGGLWSLATAEAVLKLRALRSSGDFDEYWPFHEEREHHRTHASLYAAGKVPATKLPPAPSRRRLRAVK